MPAAQIEDVDSATNAGSAPRRTLPGHGTNASTSRKAMEAEDAMTDTMPTAEVVEYLLTKPEARIVGAVCESTTLVDHGPGNGYGRCTRPVWGDGYVSGVWRGMCSRCWHVYNAFHGDWQTMRANPASHLLGEEGIRRLTFTRGDTDPLPALGADRDWDGELRALTPEQTTEAIDALELWAQLPTREPDDEQWGEAA
jgi:hypothetical protein